MKYFLLFAALAWPLKAEKGLVTGECGPGTCGIPMADPGLVYMSKEMIAAIPKPLTTEWGIWYVYPNGKRRELGLRSDHVVVWR